MIRNPIYSALGRGKPELSRLGEGITASLRQFSAAQTRFDDRPSRPSSRQRSAAAANELLSINEVRKPGNTSNGNESGSNAQRTTVSTRGARGSSAPAVISVASLRGGTGGRFAGFRRTNGPKDSSTGPSLSPASTGDGAVIRGGFRGRGRGSFSRGRGNGMTRGRGGRRGGSRSDGDDRPVRGGSRQTAQEKQEDDEYKRFQQQGVEDADVAKYMEVKECGTAQPFKPTAPKDLLAELAAYAPAVATNSTPLSQASTVLFQARMLGGGKSFHPRDWTHPTEALQLYRESEGVFFPSIEAKQWAENATSNKFNAPPEETRHAVLDAALLGKYDGPKYADSADAVGTVKSYVKRHGTWNMAAERTIEAKVQSLLPATARGGAGTTKTKGKRV